MSVEIAVAELPVRAMTHVYHIGEMNTELKSASLSHEGNGLSVGVHACWRSIARLGNAPVWRLVSTNSPAVMFLDAHALNPTQRESIMHWAMLDGLVVSRDLIHVQDEQGQIFKYLPEEFTDEIRDEAVGEGATIAPCVGWVATDRLCNRMGFRVPLAFVQDMVLSVFAEDVLLASMGVHGVWWNDQLAPELFSAPRGVITPRAQSLVQAEPCQDPQWRDAAVDADVFQCDMPRMVQ